MATAVSSAFIEIMIRRAIHELEDSPKRTLRNLVDLASNFSNGRFQSYFFRDTQNMLQTENSPYYDLVYDIVTHVDEDRLVSFGMNVGYNSCTVGANTIRHLEAQEGYNIPWSVILHIDSESFFNHQTRYHSVIEEGKAMGIHTWQFVVETKPELLLPLIALHPECAFVIFCPPSSITTAFLDGVLELNHVMVAVRYEEDVREACRIMRAHQLLYSIYYDYTPEDRSQILNDDLFYSIQQLHPAFIALRSNGTCSQELEETIYEFIKELRNKQELPAIPWEIIHDCRLVDSIISNDTCTAEFNANGMLLDKQRQILPPDSNLFQRSLHDIFKQFFSKAT